MSEDRTPEQVYNEFWKDLVEVDGKVDMNKVKAELADYSFILDQVPKVYGHVTGGLLSKPNYPAGTVITQADDHMTQVYEDNVADEINCHLDQKMTLQQVLEELDEWRHFASKLVGVPMTRDPEEGSPVFIKYQDEAKQIIEKTKPKTEEVTG